MTTNILITEKVFDDPAAALIMDVITDIQNGILTYCFTDEQLQQVREQAQIDKVEFIDDVYIILPSNAKARQKKRFERILKGEINLEVDD